MQLPVPSRGESRKDYLARVMADQDLLKSFDDHEQLMLLAQRVFRETQDEQRVKAEGHDLVAEVFAAGKWNGREFSVNDLAEIAENFRILGDNHRVPLKLGHNDEQPITDGQMALGWVEDVWVEGEKLMAKFVAIPTVVYEAIRTKKFRNVSIELDIGVSHKGRNFRHVLSAVALLGADLPAVNTLQDLTTFLHTRQEFAAQQRLCFSAVRGDSDMAEIDELKKQMAQMQQQQANLNAQLEAQKAEAERHKADAEKFSKEAKDQKEALEKQEADRKAAELKAKKEQFTQDLDELVKGKKITPAKRESLVQQWKDDDNVVQMLTFTVDQLKEIGGQVAIKDQDKANTGQGDDTGGNERDADDLIAEKAATFSAQHKVPYKEAVIAVMRTEPELAKRYRNIGIEHLIEQ